MKVRVMDVIKGVTMNGARKVSTERGLIYDINKNEHVPGIVAIIGPSEFAMTDAQALRLIEYIQAEFMRDEYEESLALAMQRHPSSKGFPNADD